MDWLNGWYADVKEQEELAYQEYMNEDDDDCICREDNIVLNCPGCF